VLKQGHTAYRVVSTEIKMPNISKDHNCVTKQIKHSVEYSLEKLTVANTVEVFQTFVEPEGTLAHAKKKKG
jgi:hypothetical protein